MTEDAQALTSVARLLSPHCRVTGLSDGALIADWKRTRFLGMAAADVLNLVEGSPEERAELVGSLRSAGCATARRTPPADSGVGIWLRGAHLLIRTAGFGRVLRLLALAAPGYARADAPSADEVGRLKQAVRTHSRGSWLVNGDCKSEAVTSFVLLRRCGFDAVLHVGVREHPFAMHAWTESAGLCIPDSDPRGHSFTSVLAIDCWGR
ncbi:lasso peptide biosynthesis B2 protein [Streptomyces cellostaticus]|uniref:lasso peptide biosynthesis B2 protein n=1 Tax=Streptomyces cellostaticus TaxID=67285 RepID=UPI0020261F77|nr:lasso peptide biosynthesis B2 protein [Streptomyces cellostaticus]